MYTAVRMPWRMHAHARPRVLAGYCWMKKCMGKKEVKLPVVDLVERKPICKFQITGYNSNRYHFLPGSTAVPRVRIFISVAKTKSELSRSPLGSWAERPQEVRAEQDGARNWG